MIRTILKPTKRDLLIQLPEHLIGKVIEVIAFEVDETPVAKKRQSKKNSVEQLKSELAEFSFNSGGYKFDRNEANDYE